MRNIDFAIQRFTEDIKNNMGDAVVKIIIYGSYARGEARENSDVDIMVLTSIPQESIPEIEPQIYDIAFDYEMSEGIMFSVNIVNEDHFNYWLGLLPYYDNVAKEGKIIA